ncbi:MAG: hypothetical protein ACKOPN_09335 [Prochlorococcaceae cyanobacterium]
MSLLADLHGWSPNAALLNPFRVNRQPTMVRMLEAARDLIHAARFRPHWLQSTTGLFWQALVCHAESENGPHPKEPDRWEGATISNRFLQMASEALRLDPDARFHLPSHALALHVSPRTLQYHLKREFAASPRDIWESLRREQMQA